MLEVLKELTCCLILNILKTLSLDMFKSLSSNLKHILNAPILSWNFILYQRLLYFIQFFFLFVNPECVEANLQDVLLPPHSKLPDGEYFGCPHLFLLHDMYFKALPRFWHQCHSFRFDISNDKTPVLKHARNERLQSKSFHHCSHLDLTFEVKHESFPSI